MKIGAPVRVIEAKSPRGNCKSKYSQIYESVAQLSNGDYLPVVFDTVMEARRFFLAAKTLRTRSYEATVRRCTVYIRKKQVSA